MDLGATNNWTITSWPAGKAEESPYEEDNLQWKSVYNTVGISGDWFGDDKYGFPSLFGDALNDQGLSCGLLTLTDSKYQERSVYKTNVFYGIFCKWATQLYSTIEELNEAMNDVHVVGPEILKEHIILRDRNGASMVIELIDGEQNIYIDLNDGISGYGITTNAPTLDWHIRNIQHYEWKRGMARQAIVMPGGFYPDERFMRIHMVKEGMEAFGLNDVESYQQAFSLTSQVLNTVTVPMGDQYGTDTGESSGEGSENPDHTMYGLIRDHNDPTLFWRDSGNPTFRRLRLADIDFRSGERKSLVLETGPYYVDMIEAMKPVM